MIYFDSRANDRHKIFNIKFPIDALLSLNWNDKQIKKLQKLDKSELIQDKLEQLRMIAEKMETPNSQEFVIKVKEKKNG